jgi:hypothetical protein
MKTATVTVRSFECGIKDYPHTSVIHHVSAAKAKGEYFLRLCDAWSPSGPKERGEIFKKMTCRSFGGPVQTEAFRRTAAYRGLMFAQIGMKVQCGDEKHGLWNGVIVDRNDSANFQILFSDGPYAGQILNCHPRWKMRYFADDGTFIFDSETKREPA